MQFNMKFSMDNAAFDDGADGATEMTRILRVTATRIEKFGIDYEGQGILDINGNRVGQWEITEE